MEKERKYDRHSHKKRHSYRSPHRYHHRSSRSDSYERHKHYRHRSRERTPEKAKVSSIVPKDSEKDRKIKGRGSIQEPGLRSWNESCILKTSTEDLIAEVKAEEELFRLNERWVSNKIKEHESEYSRQIKTAPKWQHDKFEKLLRDYENEQRQKELQNLKSQQNPKKRSKKESPLWQHDKFESVIRDNDPDYQYMIRSSPPVHEEAD